MDKPQTFSPGELRKALGTFTTGVTVVSTVGTRGEDIGLTANSFNSVSLEPPMVLWSLAKSSLSLNAFKSARYFAVHILAADQEDLSSRFARRGADKFAGLPLERGPDNIPLLTDCAARFICSTAFQYEGGDHIIFVGEIVAFDHWERPPLVFHAGQYGLLSKREVDRDDNQQSGELNREFLGELLRRAYAQVYAPVREEYERRGITIAQYYYLSRVAQYEKPTRASMQERLEKLGRCPTDREIDDLIQRNLVAESDGRVKLTEAGQQMNIELASAIKSAESDAEQGLDFELRQTLVMALEQLIHSTSKRYADRS